VKLSLWKERPLIAIVAQIVAVVEVADVPEAVQLLVEALELVLVVLR
jgi:hypothetical protein